MAAACSSDDSEPAATDDVETATTSDAPDEPTAGTVAECDWPMYGYGIERSFATTCESEVNADTAPRLQVDWTFGTDDVVTATPAVVGDTAYVGDWSGRFYALDVSTGDLRWTFDAPVHPTVYSGQIVSSAAVAESSRGLTVVFGSGRTLYALDAETGEERWRHDVNPEGDGSDPSEIQSSPVVVDGLVLFGFDGHDEPGVRAGVKALDLETGAQEWYFDPDEGAVPSGCAGVWGSPTVDAEIRLAFFGTANCPTSPEGWGEFTEALIAIDLDTGEAQWSFQPHEPNNDDFDFASAPHLFDVDGTAAVGLGNKDGSYYAVARETGDPLWAVAAAPVESPGTNFSTGGFIGPTAYRGDVIVGGTAIGGDCPCLHGMTIDGDIAWQQGEAGPTFAPSAIVNDVAIVGSTTDFTLRVLRLDDGEVLWRHTMTGAVAGGVAVTEDRVIAVQGIREPGTQASAEGSGVTAFVIGAADSTPTSGAAESGDALPPTTVAPPPPETEPSVPGDARRCVELPCSMSFSLKEPPPGTNPTLLLHVRPEPFRLEVRGDDLGDPNDWLSADGIASETGAVTYGAFVSVSDNNPVGSLVCVLDASYDCVTEVLPDPLAESYSRISILAIADTTALPEPAEGFDRLVSTQDFTPPLELG